MDNKITKKRISDHLEYDWYKYLLIIIAGIALMVFVFSQINRNRDYETVNIFLTCYGTSTNTFSASVTADMNSAGYKAAVFGDNYLREIAIETQSPEDSNYFTLLSTHGMISSDIVVVSKSYLDSGNGESFVELTDPLIEKYLYSEKVKKIDDLEYYTTESGKRVGIKVSDFNAMGGVGAIFCMDWSDDASLRDKYKDTPEENQPDKEFYLLINPESVNIGPYGKGKSKNGNAQALYIVQRFIEYYK